ncbi:MAG TPA: hypothetical protein VEU08_18270, partial [Vicinamibacterales bacterium]|nr:hypothetical protein [Vicinamibacterales bacterium]
NAYDGSLEALGLPSALTSFQGVALRAAAVLSVSFLIAAVSRRYLERPALRLRRLFEPRVPNDEPAVVGIRSIQQTPEPA